jgi:predicted NUDIX family NTP pyrophosphohydrolase
MDSNPPLQARDSDVGLVVYRMSTGPEILLVRPGGPFWSNKDRGTWSICKNESCKNETGPGDLLADAKDHFTNDTGLVADGEFMPLTPIEQKGGKRLYAFAVQCELDLANFRGHDFSLEWPPGSGRLERFPEIQRIGYFDLHSAVRKIVPPQWPLLLELAETLAWRVPRRSQ